MNFSILVNLLISAIFLGALYWMQQQHWSFTKRVFSALGFGIVLGAGFQWHYGLGSEVIKETNIWLDVVGTGYVKLLQMVVIPLIMVSIIGAILKLKDVSSLGKISSITIGTLITTTVIAACIGILMAHSFRCMTLIALGKRVDLIALEIVQSPTITAPGRITTLRAKALLFTLVQKAAVNYSVATRKVSN